MTLPIGFWQASCQYFEYALRLGDFQLAVQPVFVVEIESALPPYQYKAGLTTCFGKQPRQHRAELGPVTHYQVERRPAKPMVP
ncbi:hypothetical protein D3C80_1266070 [compost metagenome]